MISQPYSLCYWLAEHIFRLCASQWGLCVCDRSRVVASSPNLLCHSCVFVWTEQKEKKQNEERTLECTAPLSVLSILWRLPQNLTVAAKGNFCIARTLWAAHITFFFSSKSVFAASFLTRLLYMALGIYWCQFNVYFMPLALTTRAGEIVKNERLTRRWCSRWIWDNAIFFFL